MIFRAANRSRLGNWFRRLRRTLLWLVVALVAIDIAYLAWIWPDWDSYRQGPIQRSSFIMEYERDQDVDPELPELRWRPVPMSRISRSMRRAVIIAEDSRFYSHGGVDWIAFREAMEHNLSRGKMVYGGSTISQQTTKNLFLSASRNPLRKWHELVLTMALEENLKKQRILEYYLNVAQFGRGIFGVEAAAQHYWGISASQLSRRQAIELAASLPSPVRTNPSLRTPLFYRRIDKISRHYRQWQNSQSSPISWPG